MLIYKDLFFSDKLKNKKNKIINALRHGKLIDPNVYVIYLNDNTNLPELMQGYFFNQIYFQIKKVKIIGITASKDEGIDFLTDYITRSYDSELM